MQAQLVNGRSSSMLWGSFYPDAAPIFVDEDALAAEWGVAHSPHRLFLFVPPESRQHVEALLGKRRLYRMLTLADQEAGQRTLYTDRPL